MTAPRQFVVVGAGLHGCALAWELARRGGDVVLVERGVPGAEASTAAAGILAPSVEAWAHPAAVGPVEGEGADEGVAAMMGRESLRRYPEWIHQIEAASNLQVLLHLGGVIVAGDAGPIGAHRVGAAEMATLESGLAPGRSGWLAEGEGWLDPRALAPAVHAAALSAGVRCVQAEALGVGEGEVLTASGALQGTVVVCAGAWTAQVPGLTALPVRPLRGQVLALRSPPGFRLGRVVFGAGGYLVPRVDGRVLVGSTMEDVGFLRGVTDEGLARLRATARQLCPALADAEELQTWSGFRPSTPDGLPLLGTVRGIWVASGHHRNGILLAPYTAMSVADAILQGAPLPPSLRADRFSA